MACEQRASSSGHYSSMLAGVKIINMGFIHPDNEHMAIYHILYGTLGWQLAYQLVNKKDIGPTRKKSLKYEQIVATDECNFHFLRQAFQSGSFLALSAQIKMCRCF